MLHFMVEMMPAAKQLIQLALRKDLTWHFMQMVRVILKSRRLKPPAVVRVQIRVRRHPQAMAANLKAKLRSPVKTKLPLLLFRPCDDNTSPSSTVTKTVRNLTKAMTK